MGSLPTNPFDAAVYICLFVAVVMGFMTGLLRSLATILGYTAAMGLAVALAPQLSPLLSAQSKVPPAQAWLVFAAVFLAAGILLSALLRFAISEWVGPRVSIPDRVAGALLGGEALRSDYRESNSRCIACGREARPILSRVQRGR